MVRMKDCVKEHLSMGRSVTFYPNGLIGVFDGEVIVMYQSKKAFKNSVQETSIAEEEVPYRSSSSFSGKAKSAMESQGWTIITGSDFLTGMNGYRSVTVGVSPGQEGRAWLELLERCGVQLP